MNDCIFCDIAGERATASVVYRDDQVTAFLDISPINPGHLIVIPNRHFARLNEIPEELGAEVFTVASRLASALRSCGLPCDGVHLSLAASPSARDRWTPSHRSPHERSADASRDATVKTSAPSSSGISLSRAKCLAPAVAATILMLFAGGLIP